MAKRFTDTNKYKNPFTRGLQGAYKLLWDYLYHECDHAGIWIVDFEIAQMYLGSDMKVSREKAIHFFNQDEVRVVEIDNGKKWFLPSFIEFQYGILKENNIVHKSIIKSLNKFSLLNEDLSLIQFKPHTSPLLGAKEKDKDKDMDKEMEKDKEEEEVEVLETYPFEEFWNTYDKKVERGDCEKKFNKLTEKEKELMWIHVPKYIASTPEKQYRKNPETYLNNKCWNDEIINPISSGAKQITNPESVFDRANQRAAERFANS